MDKERFFAAAQRKRGTVNIDGYGELGITAMTIEQRLSLSERFDRDGQAATAHWLVAIAVDDLTEDDLPQIADLDPSVIESIGDAVIELSGLTEAAIDEEKKD